MRVAFSAGANPKITPVSTETNSVKPNTRPFRLGPASPLIIHGANDPRVPLSEAQQIYAALTSRGQECELVVYPDEGHGLAKRSNRADAVPKALAFLARHLAG